MGPPVDRHAARAYWLQHVHIRSVHARRAIPQVHNPSLLADPGAVAEQLAVPAMRAHQPLTICRGRAASRRHVVVSSRSSLSAPYEQAASGMHVNRPARYAERCYHASAARRAQPRGAAGSTAAAHGDACRADQHRRAHARMRASRRRLVRRCSRSSRRSGPQSSDGGGSSDAACNSRRHQCRRRVPCWGCRRRADRCGRVQPATGLAGRLLLTCPGAGPRHGARRQRCGMVPARRHRRGHRYRRRRRLQR